MRSGGAAHAWRRARGGVLLESLASMCTEAGHFFWSVGGQYGQAQGMCKMGLACCVARYGHAHANTAVLYSNLGSLYGIQGKLKEALSKALEMQLRARGPEHPDVASS